MVAYLRSLSGRERTDRADRHLAYVLAFVAGAVNAGGFLVVARYTSHMTGILSAIADQLALGQTGLAAEGVGALAAFMLGSGVTAVLVNWARRTGLHAIYAFPLMVEAALLLLFGLFGARAGNSAAAARGAVPLLCFLMGLQNAIITKISNARMRTTHVTGLVTDLGIELGKLFYWNVDAAGSRVVADREKMALLSSLMGLFFAGGVIGALAFQRAGLWSTLPVAALLFTLAIVPIWDDISAKIR